MVFGENIFFKSIPIIKHMQKWFELIECLIKDGVVRLLDIIQKQKILMNSQHKFYATGGKDHEDIEEMLQALNKGTNRDIHDITQQ